MNKPITTKEMEDWIKTEWTARQKELWESYVDHQNVQAAADIREAYKNGYSAGVLAEREACAITCEQTTAAWTQHLYNEGVMDCVKAIRARGEK